MKTLQLLLPLCLFLPAVFSGFADESIQNAMQRLANPAVWEEREKTKYPAVTREGLSRSVELACAYLLNHQKEEGNFVYSLDLRTGRIRGTDNQVRQAGALWAVALLNRERFTEPTRRALLLGLDFFARHITTLPDGRKCFVYPNAREIRTGAVAIYCLTLLDFLQAQGNFLDDDARKKYEDLLNLHLEYLRGLELPNGSWSEEYNLDANYKVPYGSPYFDGETLLVYCRAAQQLHRQDLQKHVEKVLPQLLARYTTECWLPGANAEMTKGFYQWGCMACAAYLEAGWTQHAELAGNAALTLSWWILHENDLLHRTGNTGYALEGLVASWCCARHMGKQAEAEQLRRACFTVMGRLAPLQFLGPYMQYNPELSYLKKAPPLSEGAITGAFDDLEVRIDVVQHQLHGMLLMLRHLF